MKKICLILVFAFAITAVIGTANATVKKCVPLVDGNQTTCTSDPNLYANYIDWAAECTTNEITSEIRGVGLCSNQKPDTLCLPGNRDWTDPSTIQETITTSGNVDENTYCWCKMTSPAVSLWVYYPGRAGGDGTTCAIVCAASCATGVGDPGAVGTAFRSALFSGMGE